MVVLAMPFLEFSGSFKQRALACVTCLPLFNQIAELAAFAILALPSSVHALVASLMVGGGGAAEVHKQVVHSTVLSQAHHIASVLRLLKSELARLNPAVTPNAGFEELRPLLEARERPSVLGLYTRGDGWGPQAHAPRLRSLLRDDGFDEVIDLGSELDGVLVDGIPPPHGFVLEDAYVAPVAELLAKRISKRMHG